MMQAHGILYMSQTPALASRALDGTFTLQLLAYDRIARHQVEPWRITWSGPLAQAFFEASQSTLKAGQPLDVRCERLRNFSSATRFHGPEFVVVATSIALSGAPVKRGPLVPVLFAG